MPTEVILPRVDMDMTEGSITAWYASEGDSVKAGEPLFDIETSKATMEVESPASGIVRKVSASVGDTVPVGTVIAWIYASGEAVQEAEPTSEPESEVAAPAATAQAPAFSSTVAEPPPVPAERELAATTAGDVRADSRTETRATPAARQIARKSRIALAEVSGSGPHGRIVKSDVLSFLQQAPGPADSSVRLNRIWLHEGNAATIVLVHGFAAESNSWRPLLHAMREAGLLADIGVLAIDLPGHGKSPDGDALSLHSIADSIEAVLREEYAEPAHLVGHSFGGAVAAQLAASSRLAVRSLTLIAPAGVGESCNWAFINGLTKSTDRATLSPWLEELVQDASLIDEAFVATAEQQLRRPGRRQTLERMAAAFFRDGRLQIDLTPLLSDLRMPVRVIWGGADRILPIAHADRLPRTVAQHRFAGVGHLPQIEAAGDVACVIREQLMR
ncbi:acetoin dehydrogenase dihydrolipoyllysine-residue acetyltransferase subunit [Trinickia sp.]|uniref:acetoin dehydrogenase dihydrolipoyllysine-residue acetyltransferase subunit n=1 Tax=Trinickia sp. TaxID=2571163 RepID=UPI003F81F3B6